MLVMKLEKGLNCNLGLILLWLCQELEVIFFLDMAEVLVKVSNVDSILEFVTV